MTKNISPKDIDNIIDGNKKVVLASGFVTTQAEIEWAKDILANYPYPDEFDSIEDVLRFKKSQDNVIAGNYKVYLYLPIVKESHSFSVR